MTDYAAGSLSIDLDAVQSVLIAGVWYDVDDNSLNLDSYEFVWDGGLVHGRGSSGICATGFSFTSGGSLISGPLTSIQAVSDKPMNRRPAKKRRRP